MKKIRVLIVDDSAIVRDILSRELSCCPEIEVAGTAGDPFIARNKIENDNIDVITLDIEMPRMDGLTFLRYLMKYKPMPVIIVSSLVSTNNPAAIQALELGAVDIVHKPGGPFTVGDIIEDLCYKIREAASCPVSRLFSASARLSEESKNSSPVQHTLSHISTTNRLAVIGASTGGTIALEELFTRFTPDFPPALAVIHMPERFTASFAERLDSLCVPHVKEAENGGNSHAGDYLYCSRRVSYARRFLRRKPYYTDKKRTENFRPASCSRRAVQFGGRIGGKELYCCASYRYGTRRSCGDESDTGRGWIYDCPG
jgi:two-component system chemotaxis response regulator CheB